MTQDRLADNRNRKMVGGWLLAAPLAFILAGCGGGGANTATPTNNATADSANANANANAGANASGGAYREAGMTWGHVEEARAELDAVIKANKLDEVHEAAYKVRDAVRELPGQSASLPAESRQKLDAQVKQVERLADMLDEAGDSNNAKSVHEHHKAMDEALDVIKALYPAGVMPGRAHGDKGAQDKPGMGGEMGGMSGNGNMSGMGKDKKPDGKNMPKKTNDNMKAPHMDEH